MWRVFAIELGVENRFGLEGEEDVWSGWRDDASHRLDPRPSLLSVPRLSAARWSFTRSTTSLLLRKRKTTATDPNDVTMRM